MRSNIINAIKGTIKYPQNAQRTVENIVDSVLGEELDKLTDKKKVLIAKEITDKLSKLELVSDPAKLFACLSVVLVGYAR